ncbi:MAG: hypothetical protein HeimC3_18260 [Candidatus Heimdallarchaeota archaeon LC_3]|nr:MAG: hypothetical protein HeimC3_18260 [Candidatus Heimdallarchaeota archaeon LC_3]
MNTNSLIQVILIVIIFFIAGMLVYNFVSVPIDLGDNVSEKTSGPFKIVKLNHSGFTYQELEKNILSGGIRQDGIPPIENPVYLTAEEADDVLFDSDLVFGFNDGKGNVYAFPQNILVWHEIVNGNFGEVNISITYCPLTGSVVGFVGHYLTIETTFGTSGKLLNSNLVMYDRDSGSFWPQILGKAINGDNVGQELEKVQLYWTFWQNWRDNNPTTKVLSENTGFNRNYGLDPYGQDYYSTGSPLFPVMSSSDLLPHKSVVIGIDYQNTQLAIQKNVIRYHKVINTNIANENITIFFDEDLGVARVYKSKVNDIIYSFENINGKFVDKETGEIWTVEGESTIGNLEPIVYFDVMWFAWVAYSPSTSLIIFE